MLGEDLDDHAAPVNSRIWSSAWLRRIGIGAIVGFWVLSPTSGNYLARDTIANPV